NQSTVLRFGVPSASHVRISLFDILGREQRVAVDEVLPAGWHEVLLEMGVLPLGTYFQLMQAGGTISTRSLALVR
ncbi:MAG: hypothetical protein ACI84D_003671, partial [Thalassolituus oleivorans]